MLYALERQRALGAFLRQLWQCKDWASPFTSWSLVAVLELGHTAIPFVSARTRDGDERFALVPLDLGPRGRRGNGETMRDWKRVRAMRGSQSHAMSSQVLPDPISCDAFPGRGLRIVAPRVPSHRCMHPEYLQIFSTSLVRLGPDPRVTHRMNAQTETNDGPTEKPPLCEAALHPHAAEPYRLGIACNAEKLDNVFPQTDRGRERSLWSVLMSDRCTMVSASLGGVECLPPKIAPDNGAQRPR